MKFSQTILSTLAIVALWLELGWGQGYRLDHELPYLAAHSESVDYSIDYSIVVTAPSGTKKLSVWIPIPPSDSAQQVRDSKWSTFPENISPRIDSEPQFGNQFAYFEVQNPQGGWQFRHQFQIAVQELNWSVDSASVQNVDEWPIGFSKYRVGDRQAVLIDDRFRSLLNEIVPTRTQPAEDFISVMNWVEGNFEYDHHDASLRANAEHGLTKRRGHCSDYHSFCASLGRVLGVPTRVTYGLNTIPKNSPSHCKLEAFLPGYGWVSYDVSETQKLVQIIKDSELPDHEKVRLTQSAQRRLQRGFRDNTWFLQTRGTDYDLAPPAAAGPVPVIRTAWIEADGVALPEPDPADSAENKFAWMCLVKVKSSRNVTYPFKDLKSLEK